MYVQYYLCRQWGKLELNFALRAAVSEIYASFQNFHIWGYNMATEKRSKSCMRTLFLAKEVEIELIFGYRKRLLKQSNFEIYLTLTLIFANQHQN